MAGRTLVGLPTPRPPMGAFALSASATKLDPTARKGEDALPTERPEHAQAWEHYEKVGTVRQIVSSSAAVLSGCRFYPGVVDAQGREMPLRDENGAPVAGLTEEFVQACDAVLGRYVDRSGSQRGLIRASAECYHVVGDWYLVGWPVNADGAPVEEDDPGKLGERWEVVARSSVARKNDRWEVALDRGQKIVLPRAAIAYRMWRRHPRHPNESTSWVIAAADPILDLRIFSLAQRSAARSSIPADITVVAAEAQPRDMSGAGTAPRPGLAAPGVPPVAGVPAPPPAPRPNDPVGFANYIEALIGNAVMEVLGDAQSGRAIVGPVLAVAKDFVKDGFSKISLARQIDQALQALVDQARKRIAEEGETSPEMLFGLGETNRWNGAQIDDTEYRRYFRPMAMDIADAWTAELLWGGLTSEAYNFPIEMVRKVRVLVDVKGVVADPDLSKNAGEGIKLGAIGWAAWRRANGFSDEDAPTPEERAEIAAFLSAGKVPATGTPGAPPDGVSDVQQASALPAPVIHASARRPTLGASLLRIEHDARLRLEEACEAALDQALARAGAKLRGWTRRDRDLALVLTPLDPRAVVDRIGPRRATALAAARYESDQQRREDMFLAAILVALAAGRRITTNAYGAALAVVNEHRAAAGLAPVVIAAEEIAANVSAAEYVLRESMLDLAERSVFDPLTVPNVGEMTGLQVPQPVIRRTMAAAGGAPVDPGLEADPATSTGFVGGPTLGAVTPPRLQFAWVYGSAARLRPFPEHLALDGVVGDGPDDPVFSGSFFSGDGQWYPGDHGGCQCDYEASYGEWPD